MTENITVYLSPAHSDDKALRDAIELVSAYENRSVSDTVRLILWDFLERYSEKNIEIQKILKQEKPPINNPFRKGV